jgi:AcrR family transcriptional regulator
MRLASCIVRASRSPTLEVQRRAGVSRGALLHHFPTHAALLAERRARKESERVVGALFSSATDRPARAEVMALTMEFVRGLALSGVLHSGPLKRQQLLGQWIRASKQLTPEARAGGRGVPVCC